jgi:hypothetical protein
LRNVGILFLAFFFLSCDKGLAPLPPDQIAEISGSVHFVGIPKDSVKILAVVLVQPPPPYASSFIIGGLNTAIFPYSLSTTSFNDTSYSFTVKPDTTYHYIGVAQNFGDLFKDWKVVAFVHDDKDSAVPFTLKPGEIRTGVNITVRFDSLPRQPFIK